MESNYSTHPPKPDDEDSALTAISKKKDEILEVQTQITRLNKSTLMQEVNDKPSNEGGKRRKSAKRGRKSSKGGRKSAKRGRKSVKRGRKGKGSRRSKK